VNGEWKRRLPADQRTQITNPSASTKAAGSLRAALLGEISGQVAADWLSEMASYFDWRVELVAAA